MCIVCFLCVYSCVCVVMSRSTTRFGFIGFIGMGKFIVVVMFCDFGVVVMDVDVVC